jgi:glycerate 2-kinase
MNANNGKIIRNWADIATTPARRKAAAIIEAGIRSVLPSSIMLSSVNYVPNKRVFSVMGQDFDISRGRVFVIGGGKASAAMARSFEEIIGVDNIYAGIVSDKYGGTENRTEKISVRRSGHPVPDENGIEAVQAMLQIKSRYDISQNDVVVCLISGGGSALMPCPVDDVTLEDKQQVTGLLLECGADIAEINCVRKHLSKTKGGQLGRYFSPATVISLILSDVIGNDLSVIASGPTFPDQSTFSQALKILEKYRLFPRMPQSAVDHLQKGASGLVEDTPKTLTNCHNFIIGDNSVALDAMKNKAEQLGLRPYIITAEQKGETGSVARQRADEIKAARYIGFDTLLLGGETTPKLPAERGQGGRNQHYVAVSLQEMKDYPGPWLVTSAGTDGSDFMADIAGAVGDDSTLTWLNTHAIPIDSYISKFDSYGLLSKIPGSLIKTGNTGTNVGDVVLYLLT